MGVIMNLQPKLKPLWMRLLQKYYNWRQRTLARTGICPGCGWRRHHGEWCCEVCYWDMSHSNSSKPTCGPLFLKCLEEFAGDSTPLLMSFSAGHMVGQAEKIYLGACSAAMFRPSPEYREWLIVAAVKISIIYDLEVSCFDIDEIRDEVWLHSKTCKQELHRLMMLQVNSPNWHYIRGKLCGIPTDKIDTEFHLRKGYNQPCDKV